MPGPIFVGGAPRSGTHIVAHLCGRHADYFMIPREIEFHCAPGGVPAYLRGSIDRDKHVSRLHGLWWKRPSTWDPEVTRGLHKTIPRADFDAAVAAFVNGPLDDRLAASRTLVSSLLDPLAAAAGKPAWVEHSPKNMNAAGSLSALFPDARFIHVVRDGRDQACSIAALPFGTTSVTDALGQWARSLRAAEEGSRAVPAEQLLVMQLEDLIHLERERSFERLLAFLGPGDMSSMQSFFESEVTPERAHIGRSRVELSGDERDGVDELYAELLRELRHGGVSCAPPERQPTVSHSGQAGGPHPFDPWSDGRAEDA